MYDVARPRAPRVKVVVLVLALLTAVVLLHPHDVFGSLRHALGLGPERVLPAPASAEGGGDYVFAMTQGSSPDPVGWNPCEEIRYSVNPADEPAGGRELIQRALERTSAVTGLAFEDAGDTDRRPFTGQVVACGERPVVIGWADPSQVAELSGQVAGLGGGSAEDSTQRRYYVTGGIVLDTEAFTDVAIAQSPQVMEAIVMHEVAHVVGLGHVNEPMELMYGTNDGQVDFGPGDLEGLAILGSLPCL